MGKITKNKMVYSSRWFHRTLLCIVYIGLCDDTGIITCDREVLFVKQYRPVLDKRTLELPSGHVEKRQPPGEAAHALLVGGNRV